MTTTTLRKGRLSAKAYGLKAVEGAPAGTFEAIVAVFGNVDLQGDRIIPGAFTDTLAEWKSSGDPIPVIFSHQWDTVEAHIGEVLEAKELLPGDPMLPPELSTFGGLWTKFALDLEDEKTYARTIDRLLSKRRIKEFSFAYDVRGERRGSDGANELTKLDVIETGPTLKGANPATRLLADALDDGDVTPAKMLEALAKTIAHSFAPSDEDASRCSLCGLTRNTVGHNAQSADAEGAKASVSIDFAGSVEDTLEGVYTAALEWARGIDAGNGGFYCVYLEATYPTENRAIVLVEGWDDPVGEGIFYEVNFAQAEDGSFSIEDPHEIEVAVEIIRKARSMKHRNRPGSSIAGEKAGNVRDTPTGKSEGKAEDPLEGKAEDSKTMTAKGSDPTIAMLELAELG